MGRTQTSATVLHSIFREKTFGASNDVSKCPLFLCWCLFLEGSMHGHQVARLLVLLHVNLPHACICLKVIDDAKRILQRRYWALVIGSPRQRRGLISAPLGKVRVLLNIFTLTFTHPHLEITL